MEHKEEESVYIAQEDSHVVMSEKVQALAGTIYQEFEKMIHKYDETVVKELMPLVVSVLECLDLSYTENQEHEVEVELLREDNEQLVTQYEREKQLRKASEQKLLSLEDQSEEEIKDLTSKTESLEAILRMLELKSKNGADHVSRLEEKESEMKKEYAKLHERYTELFKTHMDYMERTKILMGTDRLENFGMSGMKRMNPMTGSSGPVSFGFGSFGENQSMRNSILKSFASPHPSHTHPYVTSPSNTVNIHEELSMEEELDVPEHPPNHMDLQSLQNGSNSNQSTSQGVQGKSHNKKEERSGNTLYQEFSFQDPELSEDQTEITGSWVHPGDYASSVNDNFFGMGKEVENLILENNELLATKNALNIVKDDLIAKVDELTSEQEILREEIQSLQAVKSRLKLRISEVEEEVKRLKDEVEKRPSGGKEEEEEDVPMAQRKRFTRVEMARVLMERNQYKERFMELQDAVRWTEMLRAARQDPSLEKKTNKGIVSFFSSLFSGSKPIPPIGLSTDRLVSSGGIHPHPHPHQMTTTTPTPKPGSALPLSSLQQQGDSMRRGSNPRTTEMSAERLQLRRLGDIQVKRGDQGYKQTRAHVRKDDGRMQAYGWSLPPQKPKALPPTVQIKDSESGPQGSPIQGQVHHQSQSQSQSQAGKHLPVPVPIYCRPFMEQTPGMKIFCASGVNLKGWEGGSGTESSPHVWICTATHSASRVTVIDANKPQDLIQTFDVCSSHLLCIGTVPGVGEDDLGRDMGLEHLDPQGNYSPNSEDGFGRVSFVQNMEEDEEKSPESPNDDYEEGEEDESESRRRPQEPTPSSRLPTMWLGAQSGFLYIHSGVGAWEKCLHKVKLPDSVLSIAHLRGRVFVSMANGRVAIFRRDVEGEWDSSSYHLLDLGNQPQYSIRCLSPVREDIWCGFRNKIHVLDLHSFKVKTTLEAHPRKESQVRQMACCGDGVWVSIRLDSTLRLYHGVTYEHLQDVDIEPYVSKMLGAGKLGFSYARITALLVASSRLWIGTGHGVIISVPLQESTLLPNPMSEGTRGPGNILRLSGGESGKDVPYCSMSQAQLSFHGHRDSVKFFVGVRASSNPVLESLHDSPMVGNQSSRSDSILVISGGEGYIDFRVVEEGEGDTATHLIVWKLPMDGGVGGSMDKQN